LLFSCDFGTVNSDYPVGAYKGAVGAARTLIVHFHSKMISFAVHFLRHRDHREGARSNAHFTALAALGVDDDVTCNFCHIFGVDLLTDSQGESTKNILPFRFFAVLPVIYYGSN
jgi:hypothetical protein